MADASDAVPAGSADESDGTSVDAAGFFAAVVFGSDFFGPVVFEPVVFESAVVLRDVFGFDVVDLGDAADACFLLADVGLSPAAVVDEPAAVAGFLAAAPAGFLVADAAGFFVDAAVLDVPDVDVVFADVDFLDVDFCVVDFVAPDFVAVDFFAVVVRAELEAGFLAEADGFFAAGDFWGSEDF
ncbi:hypothetical protein [Paramicrobacterium agarici]|uniref:Uncharacterized protein n=1 Tax=Paramicrobacterium agarici TaxID=630514 RepID=A0A2A9DZR7_9MICO|nr:hypothetical protein [Microbacterium agarici]PFG31625.1 hypothetical protein ATJ78_2602 [Microbacterium agarici]